MVMTDSDARRRTCLHEAAHAVAELVLGGSVDYVSIRPGKTFGGIEVRVPRPLDLDGFDGFRSVSVEPPKLRADVERRIIVSLVGHIAALHLGPKLDDGYLAEPADEEIARQALANLGSRLSELVVANEVSTEPRGSDEDNARGAADAFAGPVVSWHYLEWLRCEALELVTRYCLAIVRVADALERLHVLTGEQVAALVYPPKL
jgi:hypothetical protein